MEQSSEGGRRSCKRDTERGARREKWWRDTPITGKMSLKIVCCFLLTRFKIGNM